MAADFIMAERDFVAANEAVAGFDYVAYDQRRSGLRRCRAVRDCCMQLLLFVRARERFAKRRGRARLTDSDSRAPAQGFVRANATRSQQAVSMNAVLDAFRQAQFSMTDFLRLAASTVPD